MVRRARSPHCRSSQTLNELRICRWEVQVGQLFPRHPSHVLTESGPRFSQEDTLEEVQLDLAIAVRVGRLEDLNADPCFDGQLLQQFACKAVNQRLLRQA